MSFVNRKKEIETLVSLLSGEPNSVLMMYGPKSCGKTSLLQHIVHEKLDKKRFAINYLSLRGVKLTGYDDFLGVFFQKTPQDKIKDFLSGLTINVGFFEVGVDEEAMLRKNPFKIMEDQLVRAKAKGIQPILILDEVQRLKDIYLNGGRQLIDEMLNLFVRLTKEIHAAHVILATSDSFFLGRIHQGAGLSRAVRYFQIDHLKKPDMSEWLKNEGFSDADIETVWHHIGGSPWEIRELINRVKNEGALVEPTCGSFITQLAAQLHVLRNQRLGDDFRQTFDDVSGRIVNGQSAQIKDFPEKHFAELLEKMVENDFWFYLAEEGKIVASSRSAWWAMKIVLNQASEQSLMQ